MHVQKNLKNNDSEIGSAITGVAGGWGEAHASALGEEKRALRSSGGGKASNPRFSDGNPTKGK